MNTLNRIKRSVANRSDDVLLRSEFDSKQSIHRTANMRKSSYSMKV